MAPGEETHVASEKPTVYPLYLNTPNPFNPRTMIRYDLPEDAHVTLKLNILGQEVMELLDAVQEAGYKQISVDARSMATGVYPYRIKAGSFRDVKKMVVMK